MKKINCALLFLFFLCTINIFSQVKNSSTVDANKIEDDLHSVKENNIKGYPVAPFNDTLFFIYNNIGSFSAKDRSIAISDRIKILCETSFYNPDSLALSKSDIGIDITYKDDFIVMVITVLDAKRAGKESLALAKEYSTLINKTILFQQEYNSEMNLLKRIGLVLLLISIVVLVLLIINKLFRFLKNFLLNRKENYFPGYKIKESYIFSPEKQLEFILRIIAIIRIVVLVFTLYFSLPLLFNIFPATRGYAVILLNWVFSPAKLALMGFVNFLPNLFSIIVIIILFRYVLRFIKFFVDEIQQGQIKIDGFYSDWAKPTFNIIKVLMYAFMIVIIFPYLPGSGSPIFQGVSVFVGILFSLGSSNAIANMIAGLVITYMRPFKIDDFIKIGEVSGTVLEKTALVIRIRTTKFEDITIPNATVLSSSTINYSTNTTKENANGLLIHTTVTIGYDSPWIEVHRALINAALRTTGIQQAPPPFVLQTSLDDFYVSYEINAYTREPTKQPLIYSSLHQNIQDCFNEAGLEIMSPHFNALRDGNKTTTPGEYLNKEYKTPSFNVNTNK